ncbi:MAG: cytochrome c [Anaerolineae bacterium]|nr:cytochrome c [Anaerolineae bacterium]MCO5198788.1 cytochrome c [Anaerolineae bacterium]
MPLRSVSFFNKSVRILIPILLIVVAVSLASRTVSAQDPLQPPQPGDGFAGLTTFETRCATCHGPQGLGDGELAAQLPVPPKPIGTAGFQYTAVPSQMFTTIQTGILQSGMPPFGSASSNPLSVQDTWDVIAALYSLSVSAESLANGEQLVSDNNLSDRLADIDWANVSNQMIVDQLLDTGLSDAELRDVVNFGRTASYIHVDPALLNAPLESALIAGTVINGTTGELITSGEADLRIFDQFDLVQSFSTDIGADGYRFELSNVDPNHIYIVTVEYNGVPYNSDFIRLSAAQPEQNQPFTVFNTTSDPSVVVIDELRMFIEFLADDVMRVSEFYLFGNNGDAVFVGAQGDTAQGTVEIQLPDGAENVELARSFGSEFVPAQDIIHNETSWADTQPLYPGNFSGGLLVSYELPYDNGVTLSHPVTYPVSGVSLFVPDNGVEAVEDANWVAEGRQFVQETPFLGYTGQVQDGTLAVALDGRPRTVNNAATGGQAQVRNNSAELIFGIGMLLVAVAIAIVMVQRWQKQPAATTRDGYVQQIANLDDTYTRGDISRNDYQKQRKALKKRLKKVWDE